MMWISRSSPLLLHKNALSQAGKEEAEEEGGGKKQAGMKVQERKEKGRLWETGSLWFELVPVNPGELNIVTAKF